MRMLCICHTNLGSKRSYGLELYLIFVAISIYCRLFQRLVFWRISSGRSRKTMQPKSRKIHASPAENTSIVNPDTKYAAHICFLGQHGFMCPSWAPINTVMAGTPLPQYIGFDDNFHFLYPSHDSLPSTYLTNSGPCHSLNVRQRILLQGKLGGKSTYFWSTGYPCLQSTHNSPQPMLGWIVDCLGGAVMIFTMVSDVCRFGIVRFWSTDWKFAMRETNERKKQSSSERCWCEIQAWNCLHTGQHIVS